MPGKHIKVLQIDQKTIWLLENLSLQHPMGS